MRRKPVDAGTALAAGVDHLLREFTGLGSKDADLDAAATEYQFTGPIEPTYFVASSTARAEIRAVADFKCSGDDDQAEIQAAVNLIANNFITGGTVVLSEGYFNCSDYIQVQTIDANIRIVGMGMFATVISSASAPGTMRDGLIALTGDKCSIENLTVDVSHANYRYAISVSATTGNPTYIEHVYARLGTGATDGWGAIETYNQVITDRCVINSIANGIYLFNDDAEVTRSIFIATATGNGTDGAAIHLGASGSTQHRAEGNYIFAACDVGILAEGADECLIAGNYSEALIQLKTGSNNHLLVGNYADVTIDSGASGNHVRSLYGTLTDNGTGTIIDLASPLTTKGDVWTYDTDDARLGVGTNGDVLTADSAAAVGIKWAAPFKLTTKGDLHTFSTVEAALAVGTDEHALFADSGEATGLKWAAIEEVITLRIPGTLTTGLDGFRWYAPFALTLLAVEISVGTAPTDASVIVDVNKATTTIYTTQANRPTIAAAGFVSGDAVPDVTAIADGDYLQLEIDQVGSTIAGADLTCTIRYRRTP